MTLAAEAVLESPMLANVAQAEKSTDDTEYGEAAVVQTFKSGWQVVKLYCRAKGGSKSGSQRQYKKWVSPPGKRYSSEAAAQRLASSVCERRPECGQLSFVPRHFL